MTIDDLVRAARILRMLRSIAAGPTLRERADKRRRWL